VTRSTRGRIDAKTILGEAPRSKSPHAHSNRGLHAVNEIISYATKKEVPYIKDEEEPEFGGGQTLVYKATRTKNSKSSQGDIIEVFAVKKIISFKKWCTR
jgi:hypothetical protein